MREVAMASVEGWVPGFAALVVGMEACWRGGWLAVLLDAALAKECCITRGHTGSRCFKVFRVFEVLEYSQGCAVLRGVGS